MITDHAHDQRTEDDEERYDAVANKPSKKCGSRQQRLSVMLKHMTADPKVECALDRLSPRQKSLPVELHKFGWHSLGDHFQPGVGVEVGAHQSAAFE